MSVSSIDSHSMNLLLAELAGLKIHSLSRNYKVFVDSELGYVAFDPVNNAEQCSDIIQKHNIETVYIDGLWHSKVFENDDSHWSKSTNSRLSKLIAIIDFKYDTAASNRRSDIQAMVSKEADSELNALKSELKISENKRQKMFCMAERFKRKVNRLNDEVSRLNEIIQLQRD